MCDVELRGRINPVQIVSESGVLGHYYLSLSSGAVTTVRLTRCPRASYQEVDTQRNSQALCITACASVQLARRSLL